MSEFNLSSKEHIHWGTEPAYARDDVKEFIRLLKEEIHNDPEMYLESLDDFDGLIDKLAGEELV